MNAAAGREQSGARRPPRAETHSFRPGQERPPGQKRAAFEQGKIAQHFARGKLSENEKIEILYKRKELAKWKQRKKHWYF